MAQVRRGDIEDAVTLREVRRHFGSKAVSVQVSYVAANSMCFTDTLCGSLMNCPLLFPRFLQDAQRAS